MKNTKKKIQDEELSHELFLRARQKSKMRNAFTKNMSTDIKLRKALLSKIIQASEFLGALFGRLASQFINVAVPLVKNVLVPVAADSALDSAIQRKFMGEEL